jgi:hypothetical protein
MANKTAKNLLQSKDVYNAYYGDFRGVDFSSDHTQVLPSRFAYAVNMYKDYNSAQGTCVETIPGYRRVIAPNGGKGNGTLHAIHRATIDGEEHILVHVGDKLYRWENFPKSIGVNLKKSVVVGEGTPTPYAITEMRTFTVPFPGACDVTSVAANGKQVYGYSYQDGILTFSSSVVKEGDVVTVSYRESVWGNSLCDMNDRKSVSFVMNGKLYILDGANYLVYDGKVYDGKKIKPVIDDAYVPTTRIGIISQSNEQEEQSDGVQYEQRNLLQPKFKQTFRADGKTFLFVVPVDGASVESVLVHGEEADYSVESNDEKGKYKDVLFNKPPKSDASSRSSFYSEDYKGLLIDYFIMVKRPSIGTGGLIPDRREGQLAVKCTGETEYNIGELLVSNGIVERGELLQYISIRSVSLYGQVSDDYKTQTRDDGAYMLVFEEAPTKPEETVYHQDFGYIKDYFGVEITASKPLDKIDGIGAIGANETIKSPSDLITQCTMATVFDGRVFLSGNPMCPNRVFYCGRNDEGVADPSYFGEYDHFADGSDESAVKGMIPVADVLCVLKGDSEQEGTVYYHTPTETNEHVAPKIYPSSEGVGSLGCLGACVNFMDDPVFVTKRGLDAIGQLSVRYERAIEHRSSMVDAKLINEDLTGAMLEVWNGYLVLLVNGNVYMADSRQRYADAQGYAQYEWYYLEGLGVWEGQYEAYKYSTVGVDGEWKDDNGASITLEVFGGEQFVANGSSTDQIKTAKSENDIRYYVSREDRNYLCEPTGEMIGGEYKKPTCMKVLNGNLYFGTEGGYVCAFNFDQRNEYGEIPISAYSFDGRAIVCGCATRMDNCGIPHLTKSTVKKSMIVKTKTLGASAVKIKVRTNKKPYEQVDRISSARFDFENMDFADFSFTLSEQNLFTIQEKEKKWVEKQIYLYSDELCRPFALFYMAFRYSVAGRYKE